MRKKKIGIWKKNAELFIEKNNGIVDPAFIIITKVWLGKMTMEKAEKKIALVSPETEGLFLALLAEEYLKTNKTKADLRFRKAFRAQKSIYTGVVHQIYRWASRKR